MILQESGEMYLETILRNRVKCVPLMWQNR